MGILKRSLWQLERLRQVSEPALGLDLSWDLADLTQRGWVYPDGYLTHVMVPFFDSEEEVEVAIDEAAGVYRYNNPQQRTQIVTEPLEDITGYAFRLEVLFDHFAELLPIEPRFAARRKGLVPGHLWYLGDVRLDGSHAFAPIFYTRQPRRAPAEAFLAALADPMFERGGVVLAVVPHDMTLPNGHQLRGIDDFLIDEKNVEHFDREVFQRVLRGRPVDIGLKPGDWFDEKSGQLKLAHLPETVTFTGIQKKIISIFWKARHDAPLTWAEVKRQSGSAAKTIDRAFGKDDPWTDWLERTGHGKVKIRTGSPPK